MDDLTFTTETHIQGRWILKALAKTVTCARMQFKQAKSSSLVARRGKVTDKFKMTIQGDEITSMTNNLVKCLGKGFGDSLTDKCSQDRLRHQTDKELRRIDKCDLPGKFKAWIFFSSYVIQMMTKSVVLGQKSGRVKNE